MIEGAVFCNQCGTKISNPTESVGKELEPIKSMPTVAPETSVTSIAPANTEVSTPEYINAVLSLLKSGEKIKAIQVYRDNTGVGLKEAKDFVESLETGVVAVETKPSPVSNASKTTYGNEICRQCNASIPKDNSFCPECGDARTPLKSDFNKMKDVAGGVIACVVCLVIYGFTGWVILYWLGVLGFIGGMGSYAWHLFKFFRVYIKESNTSATGYDASIEERKKNLNRQSMMRKRAMLNGCGVVALIILAFVSVGVFRATSNILNPDVNQIRMSHLTQFSTTRTIGDAFDRFFDDADWRRIRDGGNTFVEVSGMGTHNGNRVHVRVTFELLDEIFIVDSIRINGSPLNQFQINGFLEDVFNRFLW